MRKIFLEVKDSLSFLPGCADPECNVCARNQKMKRGYNDALISVSKLIEAAKEVVSKRENSRYTGDMQRLAGAIKDLEEG